MPIDPGTATLITAGSNLLGQAFNVGATANMNRKNRKWNEKMYALQREHSLADWAMVNEYNHPSQQMARFRDANLNPNLIYGQMMETGPIRGSNVESWNPEAPRVDLGAAAQQSLAVYTDLQLKEAQVNLSREYAKTQQQEQELKRLQQLGTIASTAKTWADTGGSEFKLEMDKLLKDYVLEAAKLNNQKQGAEIGKIGADTKMSIDSNLRAGAQELRNKAMHTQNLKLAIQQVLNSQAQGQLTQKQIDEMIRRLDLLDYDRQFKEWESVFRKKGINLTDPWWLRVMHAVKNRFWPGGD